MQCLKRIGVDTKLRSIIKYIIIFHPSIHPLLHELSARRCPVQCPITSSLGEFPDYYDWLWHPETVLIYDNNVYFFTTWKMCRNQRILVTVCEEKKRRKDKFLNVYYQRISYLRTGTFWKCE